MCSVHSNPDEAGAERVWALKEYFGAEVYLGVSAMIGNICFFRLGIALQP